jgi:hypothetical protein
MQCVTGATKRRKAVPLRKVWLTTPLAEDDMARLAEKHNLHRSDLEIDAWTLTVLAAEWPGIKFTLPART